MTIMKSTHKATPYLFSLPALVLFLPLVILPFAGAVWMSVLGWDGPDPVGFVGGQNYRAVLASPEFRQSFFNTLFYLVATLLVEVCVGLLLALALHSRIFGTRLYQGLFFAPVILSMTIVGLLWKFVLNPHFGLLNAGLRAAGLQGFDHPWLGDMSTALLSVCVVSGWKFAGFYMVLFLAGLTAIPEEILEASRIDGASSLGRALHIQIPLLKDTWWLCVLLCATGAFQTFDLVYVLTGGGPHYATEVVISWMVRIAFDRQRFGEGCAVAVLVTGIVVALGIPYRLLASRKEPAA